MRDASADSMRGILEVSDEPLVSVDYIGNPRELGRGRAQQPTSSTTGW